MTLPGAAPYSTFDLLPRRFLQHGWELAKAVTLKDIRREYINRSELERFVVLIFCHDCEADERCVQDITTRDAG